MVVLGGSDKTVSTLKTRSNVASISLIPIPAPPTATPIPPTPTPTPMREYLAGVKAESDGKWIEAYQQFGKALLLNPQYKDVFARFYAVNSRLRRPIQLVSNDAAWKATGNKIEGVAWNSDPNYNDSNWSVPVPGELDNKVPRISGTDVEYIWAPNATDWDHEAYFRSTINLDVDPYSAQIEMNVDHEYDLYINGKLAGSDHASDGWSKVESYDVTTMLHSGKNVVGVYGKKEWGLESFAFRMDVQQLGPMDPALAKVVDAIPTPTPTATMTGTPTPTSTSTLTPTSTPTATPSPTTTPTPDVPKLEARLSAAWAKGDWPGAISTLNELTQAVPSSKAYKDKLYVAYFNYGKALLTKGDKAGAAQQFEDAQKVDPTRGEAQAQLLALTPTPIPPTATLGSLKVQQQRLEQAKERAKYLTWVGANLMDANAQLNAYADLDEQYIYHNNLWFDSPWRAKMFVVCHELESVGAILERPPDVPPDFATLNGLVLSLIHI